MGAILLGLAIGYGFGSIPFGLLTTKLAGAQDPRAIGSGNIGATNVLRTGRKGLAAVTLLGDGLKATIAILIAAHWGHEAAMAAAFGAFIGHIFPIWLRFKGGKGVATYIGCLLGLAWPFALAFIAIWLAVAYLSKYSSAGALAASAATPLLLLAFGYSDLAALFGLMTVILWLMHRENIKRLRAGAESRIGSKASGSPPGESSGA